MKNYRSETRLRFNDTFVGKYRPVMLESNAGSDGQHSVAPKQFYFVTICSFTGLGTAALVELQPSDYVGGGEVENRLSNPKFNLQRTIMSELRLFILNSSEWGEDDCVSATLSSTDAADDVWKVFDRSKLNLALDSLQANTAVDFHPRASLEEIYSGQQLTVYRSGRIEWNGNGMYPGYDIATRHIWGSRVQAMELWVALLEGRLDILDQVDWRSEADSHCPVCGVDLGLHPWGKTGEEPSYSICKCCGCEFGINDRTARQITVYRDAWQAQGAPWFVPAERPSTWSASTALRNVPTDLWRTWQENDE